MKILVRLRTCLLHMWHIQLVLICEVFQIPFSSHLLSFAHGLLYFYISKVKWHSPTALILVTWPMDQVRLLLGISLPLNSGMQNSNLDLYKQTNLWIIRFT